MENNSLTKEVFLKIIKSLNINYNEGIQSDEKINSERVVFWDYAWEPVAASGENYNTVVTYQISYFNYTIPRESIALKQLLRKLVNYNINSIVSHEYIEKNRVWHSYFSIDILENVF